MEFKCEFCNKNFSNKSNFKTHQIKAKFCLKMQNITPDSVFKCSICDKSFNVKSSYDRHESICKNNNSKLIDEIEELKKLSDSHTKNYIFSNKKAALSAAFLLTAQKRLFTYNL